MRALADGGAGQPGRIHVARKLPDRGPGALSKRSDDRWRRIVRSAAWIDLRSGNLQTGAGYQALVDGVAQLDRRVGVSRSHVLERGESGAAIFEGEVQTGEGR